MWTFGEQQLDVAVVLLENGEGLGNIHRVAHPKPCILKDVGGIHEDEDIVVDDERAGRIWRDLIRHATGFRGSGGDLSFAQAAEERHAGPLRFSA